MIFPLRQSTASQEVKLPRFVDSIDGNTEETALSIANTDIKIWKTGAITVANKNSGGATHIANGLYYVVLDATDTDTLGPLTIDIHVAGALSVQQLCTILPAVVYDALILGTDLLDVSVTQWLDTGVTAATAGIPDINVKNMNAIAATAISTINANQGTTQPINFTGTGASALAKSDMVDVAGAAVSTTVAQLGVNAVQIGGTAQTARDIGASVLLSSGTGAGQLDFTSGVVKANLAQILGTALTETAGQIAAAFKKFFDKATPTGTINSIPDAIAGAAGGLFIAGSNAATTANITGNITGNVSGSVGSVTGNVGGNVVGSVGSVIAAVVMSAKESFVVRNGTAQAGAASTITLDASAAATDSLYVGALVKIDSATGVGQTRIITAYNGTTKVATVDRAWVTNPDATSVFTVMAYEGAKLDSSLQVTTGAVAADAINAAAIANGAIDAATFASGAIDAAAFAQAAADKVWATSTRAITDKVGFSLSSAGIQAIWDALTAVLTAAGSIGKRLVDNIDVVLSTRATPAQVNTEVDTALADINLDQLVKLAVTTDFPTTVHLNSVIGQLADNGTAATFDRTTDSLEAIRDRGDAAWITGGGGGITDILNVVPLIPPSVDIAATATFRLGLMLFNALDDLPTTAEITPGTISIDHKAIGAISWSAVVTDAACSEAAGLVYYDAAFASGSYSEGDSLRITFKSQKITVAANDYEITDATGRLFYSEVRQTERGTNSAYTGTPPTVVQIRTEIDSNSSQLAKLGTPAGASVSADIASVQADTDNMQTRLPAALVSGRMDSNVQAMANNVITAAIIATDAIGAAQIAIDAIGSSELAASAVTEIQSGLATSGSLATAQADLDDIQTRLPAALTVGGNIKADVLAVSGDVIAADNAEAFFDGTGYAGTNNVIPTVTTATNLTTNNDKTGYALSAGGVTAVQAGLSTLTAAGVWGYVVEGSYTALHFMRIIYAGLAGKLNGAATTTVNIRDAADTKNRIVASVDADGNRTSVTVDGS